MSEVKIILRVDHSTGAEPVLFVDSARPEISWKISSDDPAFRQTAYQLAAQDDAGRCVLDSMVASGRSQTIPWSGKPLAVGKRLSLRVRLTDQRGRVTPWSAPVVFERAPDSNRYWGDARWIWFDRNNYSTTAPSPYFRREFEVTGPLRRAVLRISARGVFTASLDGAPVSRDLFSPGWTDFKRQIPFVSYDLTDRLAPGRHCLGAILADGWCCGNLTIFRYRNVYHDHPELLAQLELHYADGSCETLVTDPSWRAATGPILAADLYDGENYDARLEMPGWDTVGFDDSRWIAAAPGGAAVDSPPLVPRSAPPVRCMQTLAPVQLLHPKKDTWIWDFGQNFTGIFRVRLRGLQGRLFTFRTAEMLEQDGSLYTLNYRSAKSQDSYICRGSLESEEWYEPHFTFHGFRYLQIDGFQFDGVRPQELEVTGLVLHSAMELAGEFSCGSEPVTRLWKNAVWGQRGNFLELPTDCPQRDERLGWTGDAQVFAPAAIYNMECRQFYRKYLRDVREGMTDEGAAPSMAPAVLHMQDGAAGWGDVIILLPMCLYRHYGWTRILGENYDAMCRSIRYQIRHSEKLLRTEPTFGDWLAPQETSKPLVSTAFFAKCASELALAAGILGKKADEQRYVALADRIAARFRECFTGADGMLVERTQTALALALAFDLLPEQVRMEHAKQLDELVRTNGCRLATGFLGTPYLLPVLEKFGFTRTARDLLLQEEMPSWLYSVRQGATTIWERWNSFSLEDGFGDVSMNSFNHYAYGIVLRYLVESIGGIAYSAAGIVFRIVPDRRFSPARVSYESPYGRVASAWSIDDAGKLSWQVEVPPGIPAEAHLPDGKVVDLAPGSAVLC